MKRTEELKRELKAGHYDRNLFEIYVDAAMLPLQKRRYVDAIERFEALYGVREAEIYSAPGRSEVGGNHTDHQHGQVLAAGLNLDLIAVAAPTEDGCIRVVSDTYDIQPIDLLDLEKKEEEEGSSESLIRGVAAKMKADGFRIGGFCAYMTSNVLVGSGMSSSAAFEVAVGTVLSGLYNEMKIDPVYIAQVSQYAENIYFGKPCGLMDQMASSVGSLVNIDFRDTEHPLIRKVDVDFTKFGYSLCIVDTKGNHEDLTPEYAAIPADLKKVCDYFGCRYLREVDEDQFYREIRQVREAAGDRAVLRAIHVFDDNARVSGMVTALESGDFDSFKRLIIESGESSYMYLQNVYPTADVNRQELSVALALSARFLIRKGAWRVHGGGFAGTIQAFVPDALVEEYKRLMDNCFGDGSCHVLKIRKFGGMKVM